MWAGVERVCSSCIGGATVHQLRIVIDVDVLLIHLNQEALTEGLSASVMVSCFRQWGSREAGGVFHQIGGCF